MPTAYAGALVQNLNLPIPQLNGQTKLLLRKWESATVTAQSESPGIGASVGGFSCCTLLGLAKIALDGR